LLFSVQENFQLKKNIGNKEVSSAMYWSGEEDNSSVLSLCLRDRFLQLSHKNNFCGDSPIRSLIDFCHFVPRNWPHEEYIRQEIKNLGKFLEKVGSNPVCGNLVTIGLLIRI